MLAQNCLLCYTNGFILSQIAHHTYIQWLWVLHLLLSPFSPLRVRLVWSVTESGIVHNKVCRVVWIYLRKAKIRNWKLRCSEKAIWLYVCCLHGKSCMCNQTDAGLDSIGFCPSYQHDFCAVAAFTVPMVYYKMSWLYVIMLFQLKPWNPMISNT